MKIERISVYTFDLPYVGSRKDRQGGASYEWGKGYVVRTGCTYVVRIDTDEGITGWGEICPIGSNYAEAFPLGVPAGVAQISPLLIGKDPTKIGMINAIMDDQLMGQEYVKTPIDVACWDILGRSLNAPIHALLGGRQYEKMPMYRVIPMDEPKDVPQEMDNIRAQGYRQFQVKVGRDPEEDAMRIRLACEHLNPGEKIFADANRGWRRDEALKFVSLTKGLFFFIEQPCNDYHDCLAVRRKADQPIKLDESIVDVNAMLQAFQDDACDEMCIKIARVGGLTKARQMRDLAAARGLPMTVEDSWGAELVTAALAHLAASTPIGYLMNTTDLQNYNTVSLGTRSADGRDGYLEVNDDPGLGVMPDMSVLGDPIAVHS